MYLPRTAAILFLSFWATAFAAPTPTQSSLTKRDEISDAVSSAVPIASSYGDSLGRIVKTVASDPILQLSPYVDTYKSGKYNIPNELSAALETALQGTANLPSIGSSKNPSQQVIDDYGPLVIVVSRSLFYSLIDIKLLSSAILDPVIPGYFKFANGVDDNTYQFVKGLDQKFQGFSGALADEVGENTPLGQAIKGLGGNLFHLLFDHL